MNKFPFLGIIITFVIMNVSDALPIQFWPMSSETYNERANAFIDHKCFFQEFTITDTIKLQVSNEVDTDNKYWLRIDDVNGTLVDFKSFTKTLQTGYAHYDLTFDMSLLTSEDTYFKFYILRGDVESFDATFDGSFLGESLTYLYKSDLVKFSTQIKTNPAYGTFLILYKSIGNFGSQSNFAGLNYPNNGNYFNLRIPCRFFEQRNNTSQSSLQLSNSKVINTSVILSLQQYMTVYMMPDYMHNKIQLALAHAVRGSLLIDGFEWTVTEGYERSNPDKRNPLQFGKVWLSRKNTLIRNII